MKIKVIELESKPRPFVICVVFISIMYGMFVCFGFLEAFKNGGLAWGISFKVWDQLFISGVVAMLISFPFCLLLHFSEKYVKKEIEIPQNTLRLKRGKRVTISGEGDRPRHITLDEPLFVTIKSKDTKP